MATYTDVQNLDVTQLQVGDIINYTSNTASLNLKGFKFSCRLKGVNRRNSSVVYIPSSGSYGHGANCYAEFDFSSVSDGNITVGSNYGAYIALTNGTGTDIKYNRIMVAGDAGNYGVISASGDKPNVGGDAGLFGGSAAAGAVQNNGAGGGGTQSTGGSAGRSSTGSGTHAGEFGAGGSNTETSTYNHGGAGGAGWYGGGSGGYIFGSIYTGAHGGGGGSSYLLTDTSYKPTGYLPEWQIYAPLISNGSSALLTANRDYYVTIIILEVPSGVRTFKYYNGTNWVECYANYYDGTQFKRCTIHRYDGTDWD